MKTNESYVEYRKLRKQLIEMGFVECNRDAYWPIFVGHGQPEVWVTRVQFYHTIEAKRDRWFKVLRGQWRAYNKVDLWHINKGDSPTMSHINRVRQLNSDYMAKAENILGRLAASEMGVTS